MDAARNAIDNAEQRLGLTILPTGSGAPTPIANNSVAALLAIAQERNMIVVFDAPPALTNAEGLQLAAIVDAVYVSALGRTKRSELRNLRIQLENVQADVAGALLNRTSRLNILPTGSTDVGSVSVPTGTPGGETWQRRDGLATVHNLDEAPPQASPRFAVVSDEEDADVIAERPIEPGDVGS